MLMLVVAMVGGVVLAGCATAPTATDRRGEVDGTAFEFSSGGTALTDEFGAWTVRVRGDAMWISQYKDGAAREFGTFQLSAAESRQLWGFIEVAKIARRPAGRGFGTDVPAFSLTVLRPKTLSHTTVVTSKAAMKDADLDDLVSYVQKLVRKYTGKKAIIWPPDE
jgi:hypothetical protein